MVDSKRRSSTSFNGQVGMEVVDLPLEIISDILTRLPIESILTCRVVCKSWYDLTRDPDFVNLQLSRLNYQPTRLIIEPVHPRVANYNHLLLLDAEEHKIKQIPVERTVLRDAQIMCSCNGLLCITPNLKLDPIVIYNPLTRKRKILPPSAYRFEMWQNSAGLGFDLSTSKYKVVREYRKVGSQTSSKFEILSLGERSWRELSVPPSVPDWSWYRHGSLFWKGALYWRMIKRDSRMYYSISILAFDLSEEQFHIISFPKKIWTPRPFLDLLDLDGRLTIVEHEHHTNMMKLWRLTGNKIGDFSFCLERTYDTHVIWNDGLFCKVISGLNHNGYLLYVVFSKDRSRSQSQSQSMTTHVTNFFPQMAQYLHLDFPLIPDQFFISRFKPSLVCPVAASLPS